MPSKIDIEMNELRKKIDLLFDYRKFPILYQLTEANAQEIDDFNEDLVALQSSIYHLDAYLEGNYEIAEEELDKYWASIHNELVNCGVDREDVHYYCRHIYKYQKHELGLRSGASPLRFSMEYFYFYKSCDVKLLRRLLMDRFPKLRRYFTEGDWRYFDLVTEVNDDVEDIYEDLDTINGNLFFLMIERDGIKVADQKFSNFVDLVGTKAKRKYDGMDDFGSQIYEWTQEEVVATQKLIADRVKNVNVEKILKQAGNR